jgi:curved DNA-binding protein CbpA
MIKAYYKILGIPRTASTEDIVKQYRKLAKMFHPDLNKDPKSLDTFLRLTEAFRVLGNLETRLDYSLILWEQDTIKEDARRIYRIRKSKMKK